MSEIDEIRACIYPTLGGNYTQEQEDKAVAEIASLIATKENESSIDGCPCLLVEPCSYACSCARQMMSGGCMRCCKYGSLEQRLNSAKRLAKLNQQGE